MAEHQVKYTQNAGLPIALSTVDKILNWRGVTHSGDLPMAWLVARLK